MARTLIASDDFNRADGAIGANWLYVRDTSFQPLPPEVLNNVVVAKAIGGNYQVVRWAGTGTFANGQYAKATVGALSYQSSDYRVGVVVRCSTDLNAAADYYAFWVQDDGSPTRTSKLVKVVNGTETVLDTRTSAWASGDTISLEAVGTTISAYKNDVLMFSVTDSSLTAGKPGLMIGGGSNVPTADNWQGGDVTSGTTLAGANAAQANSGGTGALIVTVTATAANAAQSNNSGTGGLSVALVLASANASQVNNSSTGSLDGGTNLSGASAVQANSGSTGALTLNIPIAASNSVQYSYSGTGSLLGGLTTPPLKNNAGALLTSQSNVTVHIYQLNGALVATKTGQATDTSGVITLNDPSLVSGTTYRLVIVLASGAEGMAKVTAL